MKLKLTRLIFVAGIYLLAFWLSSTDNLVWAADPAITSPAPSSELATATITFTWNTGTQEDLYRFHVGTKGLGSTDIIKQNGLSKTSLTVTGIPLNGNTVYVRLWWRIGSNWNNADYVYHTQKYGNQVTSNSSHIPEMKSPALGSTLTESTVVFQWNSGRQEDLYRLHVGVRGLGSTDIIKQNGFAKPSLTVTGIPTNGDTVYVRLWWRIGSNWNYTDYVYQAHVGGNQPNTTSAGGSTYYVDDDGSDITGDGTNKNPWKTINYGMGHRNFSLSPGDTLIVKNGNYSDPNGSPTKTINIGVRGTAKDWITIKSENKWGAVLDGKNHKIIKGVNFQPNTAYVRLENFEIKNYKASGISLNQANISNIYIYGNNIHHIAGSSGIATYKGTSKADATQHVTIDSNIIHNIGKSLESGGPYSFDHALYLRGHHQTVINNIFYNNKSGWSIHLSGHNRDLNDFYHYIANNTIIADNHDYRGGKFGGILVRASSVWIENNIIIVPTGKENSGGAINIYSEGVGCEDNLFINNNLTNANNVFAEHDKTRKHVCNSGVSISNNKVGQDAKKIFVSKNMPSALDTGYKLQIGSPAIDEGKAPVVPGLPGGKLIYDYRKTTARPKDSRYNIGAYEAR